MGNCYATLISRIGSSLWWIRSVSIRVSGYWCFSRYDLRASFAD